jgi:hypothetical protein
MRLNSGEFSYDDAERQNLLIAIAAIPADGYSPPAFLNSPEKHSSLCSRRPTGRIRFPRAAVVWCDGRSPFSTC